MRPNRMFFSQEAVDRWLEAGEVDLEGDMLSLPGGPTFRLTSGVVFKSEVSSGDDPLDLCGRAKSVADVQALEGELVTGSVIIGDHAYEVVDGFLGELVTQPAAAGSGAAVPANDAGLAAPGGELLRAVARLAGRG